jgi:Fur family transcriptional regulator, ferric uptake regulator
VYSRIEKLCLGKGLRMTEQRKIVARVISESKDHPDVEEVFQRAAKIDSNISLATVYRTVKLFEGLDILERHDFKDGRARYEAADATHHDHLIDIESGKVVEFTSEEIEKLQKVIAEKLGYRLIGHRLELYGVLLDKK